MAPPPVSAAKKSIPQEGKAETTQSKQGSSLQKGVEPPCCTTRSLNIEGSTKHEGEVLKWRDHHHDRSACVSLLDGISCRLLVHPTSLNEEIKE